jgi:hypothetical protein
MFSLHQLPFNFSRKTKKNFFTLNPEEEAARKETFHQISAPNAKKKKSNFNTQGKHLI